MVAQHWEEVGKTKNHNVMSEKFMEMIKVSFDRLDPKTTIKVYTNTVKRLSNDAKKLMAERKNAMKKGTQKEYKGLRNECKNI